MGCASNAPWPHAVGDHVESEQAERRGDRRTPRRRFVARERRSGFDRRDSGSAVRRLLAVLRDYPISLFALLIAINVMNVLDYWLTLGVLGAGFSEGNPLMAYMFSQGTAAAGWFKFLCVALVSVAIWPMRRYRLVLQVAVFAAVIFVGVLLVHAYGHAFYY
jgi:hypothetical protein